MAVISEFLGWVRVRVRVRVRVSGVSRYIDLGRCRASMPGRGRRRLHTC